jgi:hypothetical protein
MSSVGRSFSWLDQRVRNGEFTLLDGTVVQPLRSPGGYRYFTIEMLREVACCCSAPLVLIRRPEVGLPRAGDNRPPRHRRIQDPWLSAVFRAVRGWDCIFARLIPSAGDRLHIGLQL